MHHLTFSQDQSVFFIFLKRNMIFIADIIEIQRKSTDECSNNLINSSMTCIITITLGDRDKRRKQYFLSSVNLETRSMIMHFFSVCNHHLCNIHNPFFKKVDANVKLTFKSLDNVHYFMSLHLLHFAKQCLNQNISFRERIEALKLC